MLNKAMHKTRLTQNMKAKHTNNAKTKTRKGEREKKKKKKNHLEPFPSTHWKNLSVQQTFDPAVRGKS